MTQSEQKRIMYDVFGCMMMGGHLFNERKMTTILKAIHHILHTQEKLSIPECDDCLLYFFQEYAKGCSEPISESYIRANMIPTVKNCPYMDVLTGASILSSVKKQ